MRTQQAQAHPRLAAMPRLALKPITVVCGVKGCAFVASALTEALALRGWAAHRIRIHQKGSK